MATQPTCPFCQHVFETVEELTRHLVFEDCPVEEKAEPEISQAELSRAQEITVPVTGAK